MKQAMHIHAPNKFLKFSTWTKKTPKKEAAVTAAESYFSMEYMEVYMCEVLLLEISAHAQPPFEFGVYYRNYILYTVLY